MTDLDAGFEWNPFYEDLDVSDSSALQYTSWYDPLDYPTRGNSMSLYLSDHLPELPLAHGFLYECPICMTAHSPTLPCSGASYLYALQPGAYSLQEPVYVADKSLDSAVITANYRKWLLSVSP